MNAGIATEPDKAGVNPSALPLFFGVVLFGADVTLSLFHSYSSVGGSRLGFTSISFKKSARSFLLTPCAC